MFSVLRFTFTVSKDFNHMLDKIITSTGDGAMSLSSMSFHSATTPSLTIFFSLLHKQSSFFSFFSISSASLSFSVFSENVSCRIMLFPSPHLPSLSLYQMLQTSSRRRQNKRGATKCCLYSSFHMSAVFSLAQNYSPMLTLHGTITSPPYPSLSRSRSH